MRNKIVLVLCAFLAACGTAELDYKPVTYDDTPQTKVNIPKIQPMSLSKNVKWQILNSDDIIKLAKLIEENPDESFVLFALTTKGYENLSLNTSEIYRYMSDQTNVIEFLVGTIDDRINNPITEKQNKKEQDTPE